MGSPARPLALTIATLRQIDHAWNARHRRRR